MPGITGFQANSTLAAGLWIYKPDPAVDTVNKEVVVNVNRLQYFESTPDHNTVWLYYDQTSVSSSQAPYELKGPVAQAFMTDMEKLFSGAVLKPNFDLGASLSGTLTDGFVVLTFPFPTTVTFPAGLTNSQGVVGTAPAADAIFTLYKNGIPFGTMTFLAGATRAVFASAADITFTVTPQVAPNPPIADVLTVVGPTPADSTLSDLGFVFAGNVVSS